LIVDYYRHLIEAAFPDAIGKMKQFACYFTHGVRNGAELRAQVHHAATTSEVLNRVEEFFSGTVAAEGQNQRSESSCL
jgi:tRNA-dihydrouridine synthase B